MDERRSDGIAVIAAIIIMALMGLTLLVSCKTKEIVRVENITVHDTVRVHKTDTVRDLRVVTLRDTTSRETERIVTLKEGGDTLRIVTNNTVLRYIYRSDSTDRYRHVIDSLRSVIRQNASKEIVKEKRGRTWTDTISAMVVLLACVAFFYFIWRLEKKDGKNKGEE